MSRNYLVLLLLLPVLLPAQITQIRLTPTDGTALDAFGEALAVQGDYLVIGANGDDDNGSNPAVGRLLQVYDLTGRLVATLRNSWQAAGEHVVYWNSRSNDGRPVSAGNYVYRIYSGNEMVSGMMILLE